MHAISHLQEFALCPGLLVPPFSYSFSRLAATPRPLLLALTPPSRHPHAALAPPSLLTPQGYANSIRRNYSESGMPLAFFNHCWKAHRYTKILDYCGLVSYHATCEMVARSKRAAMNASVTPRWPHLRLRHSHSCPMLLSPPVH